MLKTTLSLIDGDRTIHAEVHDGLADVAMAALSAEPVTIDEWRAAMARFVDPAVTDLILERSQPGLPATRAEGGHLIVDMTAKLLVLDTTIPQIPKLGNVQTCNTEQTLDQWLPYRIPDDWEMVYTAEGWEQRAEQRRQQLHGSCQIDHRKVLYGQLAMWLATSWLQQAAQLDEPTQQLHEAWLLTPRPDLQGQMPRQVLLSKREFIDGDIQDQGQTWTLVGSCPPGLAPTAHAFRFGGFGTHEIILYHEMVAYLLAECERRQGNSSTDQLDDEVRHLEQLQQEWLHQPHPTLYDQSPAAIIARERARLPAVVPKGHSSEHDDCPICRMMYDSGQPMIWQLDNFLLDHCFATSFYDTFEQWQTAQQQWAGMRQQMERQDSGNSPESGQDDGASQSVWQRSHTNMQFFEDMPPLEACGVMMFSIGGHMAELIHDLKTHEDGTELCRQLHEHFDDLRITFKEEEDYWMLQSAANAFAIVLQTVTQHRSDLAAKCDDLDHKLDFLCRRYQEHCDPYSTKER